MDFVNEKSDDGPIVIIIKHAQIKEPQGRYDLCISNAWTGSKLMLDPQLKEICDFKKSLSAAFGSPTLIGTQAISGNMQSSQNSQASQYSVASRYAFNAPPKHLSELMSCAEDEIVTTVGTPHHVLTATHGWFLLTCANCKKQIITTSPPYECSSKHVTANPKIKYKVEVEVRFQDQKVRFVFWDRECQQLIGKTAEELKNIMVEAGEFDPDEYPADLDDMMGKELAFKVKAQPCYKLVSVLNYKTEETIIQYLKDQIPNNEITSQLIAETPLSHKDLSATSESSYAETNMKTPAKRHGYDSSPDDAKLSSNKVMRNIKIEKIEKQHLEM
ncbi:hypothetical protein L195_g005320 [Trifolium pratense]|uniref:Replication factor-A carboxy-terminal domain protein n=1 Tax=Trifolium pratense TaxID=57577 RepID=A0A2K3P0F9_TRIPR|nr:hypothetical protein L195_g005320 [Trifolium pratense]